MRALAGLAVLLFAAACQQITNPPVVDQQTFSHAEDSMKRVAVVPFSVHSGVVREPALAGVTDEEVSDLVAVFATDALREQGVSVVPPSDVASSFLNQGRAVPRRDIKRAVEATSTEFGATSVLMGRVLRWRERKGEALGAESPASVAYEMSLHEVPTGRRLWTSRFDHTQRTITADPLIARKYPGAGTRFLTATELARWAMRDSISSLVEGQWRSSK